MPLFDNAVRWLHYHDLCKIRIKRLCQKDLIILSRAWRYVVIDLLRLCQVRLAASNAWLVPAQRCLLSATTLLRVVVSLHKLWKSEVLLYGLKLFISEQVEVLLLLMLYGVLLVAPLTSALIVWLIYFRWGKRLQFHLWVISHLRFADTTRILIRLRPLGVKIWTAYVL